MSNTILNVKNINGTINHFLKLLYFRYHRVGRACRMVRIKIFPRCSGMMSRNSPMLMLPSYLVKYLRKFVNTSLCR